jgi:hypothetical protein
MNSLFDVKDGLTPGMRHFNGLPPFINKRVEGEHLTRVSAQQYNDILNLLITQNNEVARKISVLLTQDFNEHFAAEITKLFLLFFQADDTGDSCSVQNFLRIPTKESVLTDITVPLKRPCVYVVNHTTDILSQTHKIYTDNIAANDPNNSKHVIICINIDDVQEHFTHSNEAFISRVRTLYNQGFKFAFKSDRTYLDTDRLHYFATRLLNEIGVPTDEQYVITVQRAAFNKSERYTSNGVDIVSDIADNVLDRYGRGIQLETPPDALAYWDEHARKIPYTDTIMREFTAGAPPTVSVMHVQSAEYPQLSNAISDTIGFIRQIEYYGIGAGVFKDESEFLDVYTLFRERTIFAVKEYVNTMQDIAQIIITLGNQFLHDWEALQYELSSKKSTVATLQARYNTLKTRVEQLQQGGQP